MRDRQCAAWQTIRSGWCGLYKEAQTCRFYSRVGPASNTSHKSNSPIDEITQYTLLHSVLVFQTMMQTIARYLMDLADHRCKALQMKL